MNKSNAPLLGCGGDGAAEVVVVAAWEVTGGEWSVLIMVVMYDDVRMSVDGGWCYGGVGGDDDGDGVARGGEVGSGCG
ncbi:hypothetical protein Tco_1161557 [Tanacetum coccineum]